MEEGNGESRRGGNEGREGAEPDGKGRDGLRKHEPHSAAEPFDIRSQLMRPRVLTKPPRLDTINDSCSRSRKPNAHLQSGRRRTQNGAERPLSVFFSVFCRTASRREFKAHASPRCSIVLIALAPVTCLVPPDLIGQTAPSTEPDPRTANTFPIGLELFPAALPPCEPHDPPSVQNHRRQSPSRRPQAASLHLVATRNRPSAALSDP